VLERDRTFGTNFFAKTAAFSAMLPRVGGILFLGPACFEDLNASPDDLSREPTEADFANSRSRADACAVADAAPVLSTAAKVIGSST
jgi:hypothetical protein